MSASEWSKQEEAEWTSSVEQETDEEALSKLSTWHLPKTAGFFQAPSGHKLHTRAVLPPGDPSGKSAKAVLLYTHGLNSHVNGRGWAAGYYPRVASEGFAVFAVDIMGHGYSEGMRAMVEDWQVVFEDLERFVEALMGVGSTEVSGEQFNSGVSAEVLAHIRQLPIFVIGASMGGMIAMYTGLRLQKNEHLQRRFGGAVLGSPALAVDLPASFVQFLLRNIVVPLFKTYQMPAAVSSSSNSKLSDSYDLRDPKQREFAEMEMRDCAARFPGRGLGWHQGMLWGTAGAFSSLYVNIEQDMHEVRYPFLVMHDIEDKVCFYSGSEKLMNISPSSDKTLTPLNAGGRHALPIVVQDRYVSDMACWIRKHL